MLIIVSVILCFSVVTCSFTTCRSDCERGIIRPTNEILHHVEKELAKVQPATACLAETFLDKMNKFNLCDDEKETFMEKIFRNHIAKCTVCQDEKGVEVVLDSLNDSVGRFNRTGVCAPVSQFYYSRGIFNLCANGAIHCKNSREDSLMVLLEKIRASLGSGSEESSDSSSSSGSSSSEEGEHVLRMVGMGRLEPIVDLTMGDSEVAKVEILSGYDIEEFYPYAYRQDAILTNVQLDVHMQVCTKMDSHILYSKFPKALFCVPPEKELCVKYEMDLKALFDFFTAYVKNVIKCLKDVEKKIKRCRKKQDLEALCED